MGPWLARVIGGWLAESPPVPEPPASRKRFLTRTEVAAILERAPAGREICGDFQTHKVGSDGRHAVRAMAEAAAARGLAYLAITDHSKGLKIAGGMAARARQGDEIRGLTSSAPAILGSAPARRRDEFDAERGSGTSIRSRLSVLQALWNVLGCVPPKSRLRAIRGVDRPHWSAAK